MKNALNNQVGMLGDMFLWLVANLKQGVIYFIKQACGNGKLASVYFRGFFHIFIGKKKNKNKKLSIKWKIFSFALLFLWVKIG